MSDSVIWQSTVFLYSLLVGVILSVLYDLLRILRKCIKLRKTDSVKIGIEDIVFFVIGGILTFLYLLRMTDGKIRGFVILGEIVGFVIHHFTIGYLFIKISDKIITGIKFILKLIFKPIGKLIFKISDKIFTKIKNLYCKIHKNKPKKDKNIRKKHKKPLKREEELLYNKIEQSYDDYYTKRPNKKRKNRKYNHKGVENNGSKKDKKKREKKKNNH